MFSDFPGAGDGEIAVYRGTYTRGSNKLFITETFLKEKRPPTYQRHLLVVLRTQILAMLQVSFLKQTANRNRF